MLKFDDFVTLVKCIFPEDILISEISRSSDCPKSNREIYIHWRVTAYTCSCVHNTMIQSWHSIARQKLWSEN